MYNSWRLTAQTLDTGEVPDGFVIEECTDAEEAQQLAAHYERIVNSLIAQQSQQHDR